MLHLISPYGKRWVSLLEMALNSLHDLGLQAQGMPGLQDSKLNGFAEQ